MKILIALALSLAFLSPLAAQGAKPAAPAATAPPAPAAEAQPDVSYSLGMLIGANLKTTGLKIDAAAFLAGLKDTLEGKTPKYTAAQAQAAVQVAVEAAMVKKGIENLAAGKAFLDSNKKKTGVIVTASGLQYEVLAKGSGPKPQASDTVTVNYEGKLLSGTVFDSSIERNEPATFQLDGVIPGWTEGVQLMPVGGKYRFFVPSDLAYGDQGAGGAIEPNSVLVFEVELLSIDTAK